MIQFSREKIPTIWNEKNSSIIKNNANWRTTKIKLN